MASDLSLSNTPPATLAELWAIVRKQSDEVGRKPVVVRSFPIGTTETAVAHGLGFVPKSCVPLAQANVAIWRSKAPDDKYVYLIAASGVTADVVVIP